MTEEACVQVVDHQHGRVRSQQGKLRFSAETNLHPVQETRHLRRPSGEKRDKSTAPAAEPEQLLFGQKRQRGELTFATLARKNSTDIPEDDSQDAKRVKTIELEFVKKEEGAEMKLQIPVKPKEASEKPQEPIPEVITGEENDTYILKMAGKLWKFQDGAYAERGRVELKINCAKNYYATSRMICRAEVGNKRLLINSVFFPEMKIERKSDKRVQFNACSSEDDNSMRLFLFQCANPTEADELLLKLNEHHGFSKIHAYNMREDEKRRVLAEQNALLIEEEE
ncbi:hypothetical protein L596_024555 [Steinernema carpocapsae]|uniref:RanBD1 domain-containing protein n=1 Tax=Steinernema carpocapsae TaxID=34508 RepID=A0A4U5MH50_STECR|nr:hypothetical protein L596_024555 [Steinernema carpocapsae]